MMTISPPILERAGPHVLAKANSLIVNYFNIWPNCCALIKSISYKRNSTSSALLTHASKRNRLIQSTSVAIFRYNHALLRTTMHNRVRQRFSVLVNCTNILRQTASSVVTHVHSNEILTRRFAVARTRASNTPLIRHGLNQLVPAFHFPSSSNMRTFTMDLFLGSWRGGPKGIDWVTVASSSTSHM